MLLGIVNAPVRVDGGYNACDRISLSGKQLYKISIFEVVSGDAILCRKFVLIDKDTISLGIRIFSGTHTEVDNLLYKLGVSKAKQLLGCKSKDLVFSKELYAKLLFEALYDIDRCLYDEITIRDVPINAFTRDEYLDNDDGPVTPKNVIAAAKYLSEIFCDGPAGAVEFELEQNLGQRLGDYEKHAYDEVTRIYRLNPTAKIASLSGGRCQMKELIYPQACKLLSTKPVKYTEQVLSGLRDLNNLPIIHLCFTNILSKWQYDNKESYYSDFSGAKRIDPVLADKLLIIEQKLLGGRNVTNRIIKMYYTTNDEVVVDILDEKANVIEEVVFDITLAMILSSSLVDYKWSTNDK